MDYIVQTLNRRIKYYETTGDLPQLQIFYRVLVEYALTFSLGMLWNRHFSSLGPEQREGILRDIRKPSIGSMLDLCHKLDVNHDIFGSRVLRTAFSSYPELRNTRIGHGFVFEDQLGEVTEKFGRIVRQILHEDSPFTTKQFDLVVTTGLSNECYQGLSFKTDGHDYAPWSCPATFGSFKRGHVYARDRSTNQYSDVSPFIHITEDHRFFVFRCVRDRLLGRIGYNQIFQTGTQDFDWELDGWEVFNDGSRRKTANGTVISLFTPNYKRYIDVGIKDQIKVFLLKNRASVAATAWGHGGVGKTATIQAICEELAASTERSFDYVVFVSAKDRYYDYYTGAITLLTDRVDSLEGVVQKACAVIGSSENVSEEVIRKAPGRLLLVIDDFETFSIEEKQRIEKFIRTLDIRRHKVMITTRANLIVGEEIPTSELNLEYTKLFVIEALRSEVPGYNIARAERELAEGDAAERVHALTSGRPLFICQFAIIWGQEGSLENALRSEIKDSSHAVEFLYGRIFSYLSDDAKDLFRAAGQLVTQDDLSNVLGRLRYVTNYEAKHARFEAAVGELRKLRILDKSESDFFRVYSKEILQIMRMYFDESPRAFRDGVIARIKEVSRTKELDIEHALLEKANSARYSRSEEEVISTYRQIMHRVTSPELVKRQALLNLTDYLFNARGKKHLAVQTFRDFEHLLKADSSVARMFASYCWAIGERAEATRTLKEFFRKFNKALDANTRHEICGLLLTYEGIASIELKDEAKSKMASGVMDATEYSIVNRECRQKFHEIMKFGVSQIEALTDDEIRKFPGAARQNMLTGLYQLANVCIRLNKWEEAARICEIGAENSTDYLHREFRYKLDFVQRHGLSELGAGR